MPFQSEAQRRYLWVHHPQIARRWAHTYGKPKDLPMHKTAGRKKVAEALMARRRG